MGEPKPAPHSPRNVSVEDISRDGSTGHDIPPSPRAFFSSHPFVFLVLDCVHYVAGDRVTGEVLLNLPQSILSSKLVLLSTGTESVCIYDIAHSRERKEATSQVYRLEQLIKEWPEHTPDGQFVFPFTFKLPQYCPATFSFQGDDTEGTFMKGDINYAISVELRVANNTGMSLSHSRPMLMRNATSLTRANPFVEKQHVVMGCCWSRKGVTNLKLSIKNEEHSAVAGHVKFKLDPDNSRCSVPINHITGVVTQDIVFMLPGLREYRYSKILSNISRATWISASTNMVYEKDFEYFAELLMSNSDLNPSSNDTPLIRSSYSVEARVLYDLSCGEKQASIEIPLHVDPKNTLERLEPTLPKNWNPTENPILNVVVESSPRSISSEMIARMPVPE